MTRMLLLCGFLGIYALEVGASDLDNLGGDKDDYGCLSSAGYTWCESKSKCLKPWWEDCTSDDEDDSVETLGGDEDQFGCVGSAGYAWCEKLKNCVRAWDLDGGWEEECDIIGNASTSLKNSSFESDDLMNSSSADDGYWYQYDRKARVREWLVQFFSVAGPLFVCVPLWALYLKRRRRKRRTEKQKAVVVLLEKSITSDSRNIVVMEKRKGQDYAPFSVRI